MPVVSISHSSGFPSTFALVYGVVCGAILLGQRREGKLPVVISCVAVGGLLVGLLTRVVLGGHWMSQILACNMIAFSIVWLLYFGVERLTVLSGSSPSVSVKTH